MERSATVSVGCGFGERFSFLAVTVFRVIGRERLLTDFLSVALVFFVRFLGLAGFRVIDLFIFPLGFVLAFLGIRRISIGPRTALACGFECSAAASVPDIREYFSFNAILFFAFSYTIRGKFNLRGKEK